jgi:hypothetical protein
MVFQALKHLRQPGYVDMQLCVVNIRPAGRIFTTHIKEKYRCENIHSAYKLCQLSLVHLAEAFAGAK